MSSERVTVSLPDDVRRAAQRIAEERGTSFSAVVAGALTGWMRGRLVAAWLAEHQAAGAADVVDALLAVLAVPGDQLLTSDPDDLRSLVAERGIPVTVVPV